jgi:HAMP domain-containing protein
LVVAIPMRDVDDTLPASSSSSSSSPLGVLLTLALLTWFVVKLGLKPLRQMEATAGAIAAGDLSQRVEVVDPNTEVGRLGIALNEMLHQIEHAFSNVRNPRHDCAVSSPTRRTSCARRSPRFAATPSCSGAARPIGPKISQDDAPHRGRKRRAWACSSTISAARARSIRAGRSSANRSTSHASPPMPSTTRARSPPTADRVLAERRGRRAGDEAATAASACEPARKRGRTHRRTPTCT